MTIADASGADLARAGADRTDDALLSLLCAGLDRARDEIEERFLAGGSALMITQEIMNELLGATEAVVTALGDDEARHATDTLTAAMAELRGYADGETGERVAFDAVSRVGAGIPALLGEMRGILTYIGTCAIATRITGAGRDEFRGFADDIARYARDAATEIARFSEKVGEINDGLERAGAEGARANGHVRQAAPRVSQTLLGATTIIDRRRHDLAIAAERTAELVRGVRSKVATVLSALQIGDVTRQRIEHVQDGIRLVDRSTTDDDEREALRDAALRLFAAHLASLNAEFSRQTRQIVETIHDLARDAKTVLELCGRMVESSRAGTEDPMRTLEHGIEAAVTLAAGADEAHRGAVAAHATTNRLAVDLLDNAGGIANLRNVRDDIRCLAINAYLKCSRLGVDGRAVGVIATEMSVSGERLGTVAEAILDRLDDLRRLTHEPLAGETRSNVADDLARVAEALHRANDATRDNLAIVAKKGETVVERIDGIARALDFDRSLGEMLDECERLLRDDRAMTCKVANIESTIIKNFSEEVFQYYTMACEREIHVSVPGFDGVESSESRLILDSSSSDDELGECFL